MLEKMTLKELTLLYYIHKRQKEKLSMLCLNVKDKPTPKSNFYMGKLYMSDEKLRVGLITDQIRTAQERMNEPEDTAIDSKQNERQREKNAEKK